MKNTLITLLIGLQISTIQAEPFTVLAPNGLEVREAPNNNATIIATVPFGAVLNAEIDYEAPFDHRTGILYRTGKVYYTEVIERKRGYWLKINFEGAVGYIFSGFGLYGDWLVHATETNNSFRMLKLGKYCEAINYDPKLHWYAFIKSNGKTKLKKAEVTLKLIHEYTSKDTIGEDNEYWSAFPIQVLCNIKDSVFFLLGSKEPLPQKTLFSRFFGESSTYINDARFLLPEEDFIVSYAQTTYRFHAFTSKTSDKEGQYQIEIEKTAKNGTVTQNISTALALTETSLRHAKYKTPSLGWVGDVNSDGLLDFIYFWHTMNDTCAPTPYGYILFISTQYDSLLPFEQVANLCFLYCVW